MHTYFSYTLTRKHSFEHVHDYRVTHTHTDGQTDSHRNQTEHVHSYKRLPFGETLDSVDAKRQTANAFIRTATKSTKRNVDSNGDDVVGVDVES